MLIMHYFNDKQCFLMLNFARYTLCQNKLDLMSRESMLDRSDINQKMETWHQTLTFLGETKMLRKYSKILMFYILKTSLYLKMPTAYISKDMIIMLCHIIILSIV